MMDDSKNVLMNIRLNQMPPAAIRSREDFHAHSTHSDLATGRSRIRSCGIPQRSLFWT